MLSLTLSFGAISWLMFPTCKSSVSQNGSC